jgi:phenylpropionate dioxygenase-like ring-hydroxylating dioxygenase large terminal subunit
MMTRTENETLTSIGPGTLMGNLMRQYWIPALKSEELAERDCDPVRVMLLGERLLAFRDTAGNIGLLAEACPHRGASLFFGRNEYGGLRCAYHGWKFDVHGECLEIPCEPPTSLLRQRVHAQAYPCRERGGIVWAYMGPRELPPALPELGMNMSAPGESRVDLMLIDCNWLQTLEGDVDVDHIPILHGANVESFKAVLRGTSDQHDSHEPLPTRRAQPRSFERLPTEVADSAVGCTFACNLSAAAKRQLARAQPGFPELWAIGQFMLPFYSMLPYGSLGAHWVAARVPMDDHHTMTFGLHASAGAIPPPELMFGPPPSHLPTSPDWFGRFRLSRNLTNDFGLDRQLARTTAGAFALGAGIRGQAVQDAAIAQSMGAVMDRTREHLCAGDATIVQVRKRLLNAARELAEQGLTPPGVDLPSGYRMKQGILRARDGRNWLEELEHAAARRLTRGAKPWESEGA